MTMSSLSLGLTKNTPYPTFINSFQNMVKLKMLLKSKTQRYYFQLYPEQPVFKFCFPVASYQTIDEVNGVSFHAYSFQKLLEPFFFQFYVCFENRQVAEHMIALGSVKFEEITITIKVSSLIFHKNLRQQLSK